MLRLTVAQGEEQDRVFTSDQDLIAVGTAADNHLQLDDSFISRHHGELRNLEGRWTYRDLGSTNGSIVERGGERTPVSPDGPGAELLPGDLILVGHTVLRVESLEAAAASPSEGTVVASRGRDQLAASRERQLESPGELLAGYQFERQIGLAFDPEAMLDAILEGTLNAFPAATHAILLLADKKTLEARRQVARVRGEGERHRGELTVSMSVAKRVLEEGQSVLFQDVAAEFEDSQSVMAAGITSSLCAPLWTGEETVGLIQVESRGGKGRFSEGDLEQLSLFANRAALAIVGIELSEAERRNQLVQDLSHMITHDLKGPLTSILAFLELLGEERLEEGQREFVEIALGAAKWLSVLIAGILDVAKLEAAEVELEREPLGVNEEVEEALALISYQFTEKSIRVETNIPAGLPQVSANREFFRRIVINLAGNAVALSREGTKLTISAAVGDDGESVVVSVQDEGPGIPKEHQSRIFDKFVQASAREQSHQKLSVGLGLAFCKLAVEAHGGRIWVESEPGEGACFSFSLPIEAAPGGRE